MQIGEVRDRITDGYYAFQDYAVSHWYDHMMSSIKTSFKGSTDILKDVTSQLKLFLEDYGVPDKRKSCLGDGEFSNVVRIFNCIPQDVSAWSEWFDLGWRTSCIRSTIDSLNDEENFDDANRDFMRQIYGTRLFKCSRIECDRFTIGLGSRFLRDEPLNRHSRPFNCIKQHCPFQALGFETEAQLESHLARHHAESDADKFLFPQPPKRKNDNLHKGMKRPSCSNST
jgi:hypothetical protein